MKTVTFNYSQGVDAMTDRRMMPDGFAVVMDNVDLRTGFPKPFKAPSFFQTATTSTTRIWEFLGKWYTSDRYRTYASEVTQTQQRVYYAEEGPGHSAPQKIINDVQDALGIPIPTAPLLISDGISTVPRNLSLTQVVTGNLAASTLYAYRVAAKMANGILQPCQESQITLDSTHHAVELNWDSVQNAIGYVVFGRVGGQEQFIKDVGLQLSFLDDGTLAPSGAYASTYDSNFPYTYVYTYVRSVGTMEDESGPSPLSTVLNTGNGRLLTRQIQVDGFMDGATSITTGLSSLASQYNATITGMLYQNGGTILTFASQPLGPWLTGDGLRVRNSSSGLDYSTNGTNMVMDLFDSALTTPTNITPGTPYGNGSSFGTGTYIWKLSAVRGNTTVSSGINASTPTSTASAPLAITAGQYTRVTWSQVVGASYYQLYRSADAGVTWNLAKTISGADTFYIDNGTNESTGVTLPSVNHTQDHTLFVENVNLPLTVPAAEITANHVQAVLGKTVVIVSVPQTINQNDSVVLAGATQSQLNGVQQAFYYTVDLVATANVNISNPGTATWDGVTLVASTITDPKLILLTSQNTGSENGPWIFNGSSSALTRPIWYQVGIPAFTDATLPCIYIKNGVVNAGKLYKLTTAGAITIDTTSTAWALTATSGIFFIAQYSQNADTFTSLDILSGVGNYTYWRIYRSGDTSNFLRVAEVPVSQATYEDTVPTTALGESLPTSYTENGFVVTFAPPSSDIQGLEPYNGMLFGHMGNVLAWTPIGKPDAWPTAYQLTFSYPILFKASYGSGLIVMCQDAIYRVDGFSPTTLGLQKTLVEDGLIAPRSVQKTSHGLVYLARRGVMLTDGNSAACLTDTRLPYSFFIQPGTYTEPYSKQNFWWYTTDHTVAYASLGWDTNSPIYSGNNISPTIQVDVPQSGPIYAIRSFIYRGKYFLYYSDVEADYKANTMACVDLASPGKPITTLGAKIIDAHTTSLGDAYVLCGNSGQPNLITLPQPELVGNQIATGMEYYDGFLYIAYSTCIYKVNPKTGSVTVLAGSETEFGTTNGTGTAARFQRLTGLAWHTDGNLYACEMSSFYAYPLIRKITPAGVVTTIYDGGTVGGVGTNSDFYGIASHPTNGLLYVSLHDFGAAFAGIATVTTTGTLTKVAGSGVGHVDATGLSASFAIPMGGMAFDSAGSNLYLCDYNNNCIRKITVPGYVVTTPVGTTGTTSGYVDGTGNTVRFNGPTCITALSDTAFYIGEAANPYIRSFNPSTVTVATYQTNPSTSPLTGFTVGVANDGVDVFALLNVTPDLTTVPGRIKAYGTGILSADDTANISAFVSAESLFNTTFAPGGTTNRNIYKWEGSDQRIPMYIRSGEYNCGVPTERKWWACLRFHGEGTAQVRIYIDGAFYAQTTLTATEQPNRPRRVNLPNGTKGYGLSYELIGDYNHRATEIDFAPMPNAKADA